MKIKDEKNNKIINALTLLNKLEEKKDVDKDFLKNWEISFQVTIKRLKMN